MTFAGVADTHTALWYLFNDPRLSQTASRFIDTALAKGRKIAVSTISLVELIYLIEKQRLPPLIYADLQGALSDPDNALKEIAVTAEVAESMRLVPRNAVPDMPDRIVAATAIHLSVPVLSRDGRIRTSNIETIW